KYWCGSCSKQLISSGTFNRIDYSKGTAEAERSLRCESTRSHILRHLDLSVLRHHLIAPWQSRYKADHGYQIRCIRHRLDQLFLCIVSIDPCRILEVGALWVLMVVPESHQHFMRPRVIKKYRYIDDSGMSLHLFPGHFLFQFFQLFNQFIRMNLLRLAPNHILRVTRTSI